MSAEQIKRLFRAIEKEMAANEDFARRIEAALEGFPPPKTGSKRQPPVIDPQQICADNGEAGLRDALISLDTEQLKDVISAHGMDASRLAMKWTNRDRLIEHIVTTSLARAKKGDAFRA